MTTTNGDPVGTWQPGAAFVVSCPACSGHLGVAGRLAGQFACCPLCAATFHVPDPSRPDAPPPPLAAVVAVPRHPIRQVTASASTVTAWSPPPQAAFPGPPAAAWQTTPLVLPEREMDTQPHAAAAAAVGVAGSATVVETPVPLPAQAPEFPAVRAGAEAPLHSPLQFREPVLTVGRHGHEKELRRLSPEERRLRRGRRNIVMLLVGVAVLLVLVLVISIQGRGPGPAARPAVTDSPR